MPEPPPDRPPAAAGSPSDIPRWDGLYNADRAALLVAKLRAEVAQLKAAPKRGPMSAPPDQAAHDRVAELERLIHQYSREAVAAASGVPADLLIGDDKAAMSAHADRLIAWADSRSTRLR